MRRSFFIVKFFILSAAALCGKNLDSLRRVYADATKPDSVRLNALHALGWSFSAHMPDSAIHFATIEYEYAKRSRQTLYEGSALNTIGVAYDNKGDYPTALRYYEKSMLVWKATGNRKKHANAIYNIAIIYRKQGKYPEALSNYLSALKIHEDAGNKAGMARCYNALALIYEDENQAEKALEYHTKALEIEKDQNDLEGVAISYNGLGMIYHRMDKTDEALKMLNQAVTCFSQLANNKGLAIVYNNLGSVYKTRGDYSKALDYFSQSLEIRKNSGNIQGQASCYNNIGELYFLKGESGRAIGYLRNAETISKQIGDFHGVRRSYEYLSKAFAAGGKYKEAYEYHVLFKKTHDTLFNESNSKLMSDLKTNFEVEKKEVELKAVARADRQRVEAVNALEKKQQQKVIWFLVGGFAIVAFSLLVVINRFRLTRRQKKIIEEQRFKVSEAYEKLHEKNKEVLDSINYAKRIQQALITSELYIGRKLNELKSRRG